MAITVHVSTIPVPDSGLVLVTATTSGGVCDEIWLWRRIVGQTATAATMPPGGALGPNGGLLLAGGSAIIADTECPLDVSVEYIGSCQNDPPDTAASDPVTLDSNDFWWLGCPEDPSLNVALTNRRTPAGARCPTGNAIYTNGIGQREQDARSTLTTYDNTLLPAVGLRPMGAASSSLTLITRTLDDLRDVEAIVTPGRILHLRAPSTGGYDADSWYFSPRGVRYSRTSPDLRRTWRTVVIDTVDVAGPATSSYAYSGASFGDLCDVYSTWTAMESDGATFATVCYGATSAMFPAAYRTCADALADYPLCSDLTTAGLTCLELVTGEV